MNTKSQGARTMSDKTERRMLVIVAVVFALAVLIGAPALAGDGTLATELPTWAQVLIAFSGVIGTVILGLLGRLLAALASYAAQRTHIAKLDTVDDHIMAVVTDLWQAEVKHLKESAADGKLTSEEKAKFKKIAVDRVLSQFGASALGGLFGAADTALADKLGERLEFNLANVKRANVAAAKTADPT